MITKKTISKSMAWVLSVVMIFGVFVSSANILTETSLIVHAAEKLMFGDYEYEVSKGNTVTITVN